MAAPSIGSVGGVQSSGAATTYPFSYPTVVDPNDLIFIHLKVATTNVPGSLTDAKGFTFPSAWQFTMTGGGSSLLGYKLAVGDEDGVSTALVSSISAGSISETFTVKGHHLTDPIDVAVNAATDVTLASSWNLPTVTTLGPDRLILYFAHANDNVNNDWDTFGSVDLLDTNELYDQLTGTNRGINCSWETQAAAGVTPVHTVNWYQAGPTPFSTLKWGNVIAIKPPDPIVNTEVRPDAILEQTNDTKTLADLQRDVP